MATLSKVVGEFLRRKVGYNELREAYQKDAGVIWKFKGDVLCPSFWWVDIARGIPAWVREACRHGSILTAPMYGTMSYTFQKDVGVLWNPPAEIPEVSPRIARRARVKEVCPRWEREVVPAMYPNRILWEQWNRGVRRSQDPDDWERFYQDWSRHIDEYQATTADVARLARPGARI